MGMGFFFFPWVSRKGENGHEVRVSGKSLKLLSDRETEKEVTDETEPEEGRKQQPQVMNFK